MAPLFLWQPTADSQPASPEHCGWESETSISNTEEAVRRRRRLNICVFSQNMTSWPSPTVSSSCPLALDRRSLGGTACFTTVYWEREKHKEPKKDLLLGLSGLRCSARNRSASHVTKDQQGHRRQLVLKVNNTRHVAGERLFCKEHNSDAINRRWKEWGAEHRRTS